MKQRLVTLALFGAITLPSAAYSEEPILDEVVVTATRFNDKSSNNPINVTVITKEEIKQSSARTVPELLSERSGIATRDLFGNNAASATVDMRGFGAAAGQNTLILLDGRRITDPDLAGVQWSAIPFSAIERIEILRGSGAVLYGDGATGGVINIITRTPAHEGISTSISARAGSFNTTELQAKGGYFSGVAGVDVAASRFHSNGYRSNNSNDQTDAQANMRWLHDSGELSFKLGMDSQSIRLPGARTVQPSLGIDQLTNDPRGTSTPLDYATRDGNHVALDWQQSLGASDLNIGLANRNKNQKSYYNFGGFPSYRDGDLGVTSFTPRIRIPHEFGGDSSLVLGVDMHRWNYHQRISNAAANIGLPINTVSMKQRNDAVYMQNTSHITAATTLLAGLRNERIRMAGNDVFNAAAPGGTGPFGPNSSAAPAGNFSATKNAYDLGLRHTLNSGLALNGKVGRSFRFANVDEVYEFGPTFTNQFQFLRPQISDGIEFGVEDKFTTGNWRAGVFRNKITDEIHLDPFSLGVGNTNLPPSRRQGLELDARWQALPQISLNAAYSYTDARFLSGTFNQNVNISGKRVPLVASRKANLGASWSMTDQTRLNAALSYVGTQFMENDEANNFGMKIPSYALTDLKLVHQMQGWQFNAAVNNLFDKKYYNYAISSTATPGRFNAYTLPGRTFFVGLSYQQ